MSDYRPSPYMAARAARLADLCALPRRLTRAERKEATAIRNQLRWARRHAERYAEDALYRETRRARARAYWQDHPREQGVSR